MFGNVYKNKRVLITGHTGFKGTWLTTWLLTLGAEVCGFSDGVPTTPSMFEVLGLGPRIKDLRGDVRDLPRLNAAIDEFQPDFIFHLAAQPIVSTSYQQPIETISTNVMGVANVLESIRLGARGCVAVIITSDKCYDNVEWEWGYKETDHLGGKDIYSGSKGAAELVFKSYYHSFFKTSIDNVRLGSTRAGNVIGGGDWARDRLVPDCMRSWSEGRIVEIRSPDATRPWEHVLEPLSGYLAFGAALSANPSLSGESFNFGPTSSRTKTVVDLLGDLQQHWGSSTGKAGFRIEEYRPFEEARLLKLNCDKAYMHLRWLPTFEYGDTVRFTGEWYHRYYGENADMYAFTKQQIEDYYNIARQKEMDWAGL